MFYFNLFKQFLSPYLFVYNIGEVQFNYVKIKYT